MSSFKKAVAAIPRLINKVNLKLDGYSPIMQEFIRVCVLLGPVLFLSLFIDVFTVGLIWAGVYLFTRVTYIAGVFQKISDWADMIEPFIPSDD